MSDITPLDRSQMNITDLASGESIPSPTKTRRQFVPTTPPSPSPQKVKTFPLPASNAKAKKRRADSDEDFEEEKTRCVAVVLSSC